MSKLGDPRLGSILSEGFRRGIDSIVLVGFASDFGVLRNHGRGGAARGPSSARSWIRRTGCLHNMEMGIDISDLQIGDYGDVVAKEDEDLESAHVELEARVRDVLSSGALPFVIGGGNDQSFPNACALIQTCGIDRVSVINIDAHLDVRPLLNGERRHSGSPFRLLLETDGFPGDRFVEFGCQGSQCSAEHSSFVCEHGGQLWWLSQLEKHVPSLSSPDLESCRLSVGSRGDDEHIAREAFLAFLEEMTAKCPDTAIFVSFDMDAVRGSDCPGVSCASPIGLSADDALEICFAAGAHPNVQLFDLSEYSPDVEEYHTGKLVANMFYYFCVGYARRMESNKRQQ